MPHGLAFGHTHFLAASKHSDMKHDPYRALVPLTQMAAARTGNRPGSATPETMSKGNHVQTYPSFVALA